MGNKVRRELAGPRGLHYQIVPSDTVDLERTPAGVYWATSGSAAFVDEEGVVLTYTKNAGEWLPFGPTRVNATGTDATLYGWN